METGSKLYLYLVFLINFAIVCLILIFRIEIDKIFKIAITISLGITSFLPLIYYLVEKYKIEKILSRKYFIHMILYGEGNQMQLVSGIITDIIKRHRTNISPAFIPPEYLIVKGDFTISLYYPDQVVFAKEFSASNDFMRILDEKEVEGVVYYNGMRARARKVVPVNGLVIGMDEMVPFINFRVPPSTILDRDGSIHSIIAKVKNMGKPVKEFKINDMIELKLIKSMYRDKTVIYLNGKEFKQCKYLLFNVEITDDLEYISSIDEMEGYLDKRNEHGKELIDPETEFWGHCSNLQAWVENGYDTRILHSNLSFPLLKALSDSGDEKAREMFLFEMENRIKSGYAPVIRYLYSQFGGYFDKVIKGLSNQEYDELIKKIDENLLRFMIQNIRDQFKVDISDIGKFYEYEWHGDD